MYNQLLDKFYKLNRSAKFKYSLDQTQKLARFFGNPQKDMKFIHITGTNGKGSVTYKIQNQLTKNGLKVGRFVSPHVTTFRERVCIGNQLISKEFIEEHLKFLFKQIEVKKI